MPQQHAGDTTSVQSERQHAALDLDVQRLHPIKTNRDARFSICSIMKRSCNTDTVIHPCHTDILYCTSPLFSSVLLECFSSCMALPFIYL
jgi:hypothetical protein